MMDVLVNIFIGFILGAFSAIAFVVEYGRKLREKERGDR